MTDLLFPVSATVSKPRRLVERGAPAGRCDFPVRYGLFLHPSEGAVLVDTGYTPHLWSAGGAALAAYRALLAPSLVHDGQPDTVLRSLGIAPSDVRHVVVTHLHADHVCGLALFPAATLHMSAASRDWWASPASPLDAARGFMRRLMPTFDASRVRTFEEGPTSALPWGGSGRDVLGDGTVVAVDLPGHMRGHWGVAFPRRNRPVLLAVDAAWTAAAWREARPMALPARLIVDDAKAAGATCRTLAAAEAAGAIVVLSHDPDPIGDLP